MARICLYFCIMKFWKYQGAGNDFILLDQREQTWIRRADTQRIERLCDRRFGIGADGLLLLQNISGYDFEMVYFNADGRESTMCGNGGRCIAAFAQHLGIAKGSCRFMAIDGEHEAIITPLPVEEGDGFWVELKMIDVQLVEKQDDAYILNTGSPHFVRFVKELEGKDMVAEGRAVRYSDDFREKGINVNLVERWNSRSAQDKPTLHIRTYERGVEDETFACGTGVTAAAIASFLESELPTRDQDIAVQAKGGHLSVRFHPNPDGSFTDVWLCGPAVRVFEGTITN